MANIRIEGDGMRCHIYVDGQQINHVLQASLSMKPSEVPTLELTLAALHPNDIDIKGASIVIRGVEMPSQLELALLHYLADKYPLTTSGYACRL